MTKNIIFDFDGTLMDTEPVILASMADTIRRLNLPERSVAECKATIGLRLDDMAWVLFPGIDEATVDNFFKTYQAVFPDHNLPGAAVLFPGVADTIRSLESKGMNLAIASSRSHRSLQDFVEREKMVGSFSLLIGCDDVKECKPSPEPVNHILRTLGWDSKETVVVGDAPFDILMGRRAGCRTVAVTYGNSTREALMKAEPDHVIDDIRQLEGCL